MALWVEVTNSGGAVGFLPPTTVATVRPVAGAMFRRIREGWQTLIVAQEGPDLVGWVVLERNPEPMISHWAWLKRLMVSPSHQGHGLGSRLTSAVVEAARELGLEQVYLTCRSETALPAFYERLEWVAVGRMPGNLRMADGSSRDEIYMAFDLTKPPA